MEAILKQNQTCLLAESPISPKQSSLNQANADILLGNQSQVERFSVKVEDLLLTKIKSLSEKKQVIYNEMIRLLTDDDKQATVDYIRCQPTKSLINICKRNQQFKMLEIRTHYEYIKNKSPSETLEWYINFADEHLFGFYEQDIFAQDQIQCAEHILLPFISEYAKTKDPKFNPSTFQRSFYQNQLIQFETPILIKNVVRQAKVDTSPSIDLPSGMYGYNFLHVTNEQITERIIRFDQSEKVNTNIIAMTALATGQGVYTREEIWYTFYTAYRSFFTAVQFSDGKKVLIHTGNWGCGVNRNNKELIAFIQLIAAYLSNVSELYYHTSNQQSHEEYQKGQLRFEQYLSSQASSLKFDNIISFKEDFLKYTYELKFQWNLSD